MKKKCEALFCSNTCNPKYRYCYSCAKKKGLIGNGGSNFWVWIIIAFVIYGLLL